MPITTLPGDVHVNSPLSSIARSYMQTGEGFIADRVFPRVPVAKQSDLYWAYNREDWNRNFMAKRADRTESKGIGFGTSREQYFADVWALHTDIGDQTRANADSFFNMDRDATNFLTLKAMISKEVNFVNKYLQQDVWDFEVDGAANPGSNEVLFWDNAASTPVEDVRRAKRLMQARTGFRPNKLTLAAQVYDKLLDHPDIIERVKYGGGPTNPAIVNRQTLAALLEIDEVLVAEAIVNSAAEGATEDSDYIMGNHALLTFSPPAPSTQMPSAGYTFHWTGLFGGGDMGTRIKKFRMEPLESDRIEIEAAYDQKVVASDLGFFFNDVIEAGNVDFTLSQ